MLFAFVGPPPDGHQATHLDGDRTNNDLSNLKWVDPAEWAPQVACRRGHAFTPENTITRSNGARKCRTCQRDRRREWRDRRRRAASSEGGGRD
ncbi:HNH endonuclease [Halostreptopolyspora alba]|uniref:HNH endonuclease n=1 Tax=Halostreptopolyspora alba TaxID=2487137 RepID=UPI00372250F7